ncbi:YhgE/Pip family protein [Rhodococcus sp. NPDC055112]
MAAAATPGVPDQPTRRIHLNRAALAAIVIAPLALIGFYMWALWNPGDTLDRLPVAIVNNDAGADMDGTRLEAGKDVAASLIESGDVAWQEVDLEQATAGVEDGEYYFSLVIPQDFSADIASAGSDKPQKARLEVVYNDHNSLVATPVGEGLMAQVRSAVSESIGEQSVDQVLVGLGDVGKGLEEAASGARQLSAGTGEALSGTTQLADGSVELSAGLSEAHAGSGELASGASELAAGSDEAAAGAAELKNGLGQLVTGTDELGAGAKQISEVIDTVVGPLVDTMVAAGLPTGNEDVAGQLKQLQEGARELAFQLSNPAAEYRGGLQSAATGAGELSGGLGQLADGAHQLSAGAGELNSGLGQLDAGGVQLRDGLGELKVGVGQLDDGSTELAKGLADGAAQVPAFTPDERKATAAMLASPVSLSPQNINVAAGFGPGAVPVVMSVALFLLGILIWFVIRPTRREGLRRYRVPAAVMAGGAVLASIAAITLTGAEPPSVVMMVAVMLLIGAAALALARMFTVVFGAVNGTFIALGLLMVQLFSFGGVFPIEQMPQPFRWLQALMPLTYARNALRMTLSGYYGPRFWFAVLVLLALVAAAVAVTLWWRRRTEDPVAGEEYHDEYVELEEFEAGDDPTMEPSRV